MCCKNSSEKLVMNTVYLSSSISPRCVLGKSKKTIVIDMSRTNLALNKCNNRTRNRIESLTKKYIYNYNYISIHTYDIINLVYKMYATCTCLRFYRQCTCVTELGRPRTNHIGDPGCCHRRWLHFSVIFPIAAIACAPLDDTGVLIWDM